MPLESNFILYHCNDEKRYLKFLNSDTYMIISNSTFPPIKLMQMLELSSKKCNKFLY
jgi:hypothetical protein